MVPCDAVSLATEGPKELKRESKTFAIVKYL